MAAVRASRLALTLLGSLFAMAPAARAFTVDDAFHCFDGQPRPCFLSSGSTVDVGTTLENAARWSTIPVAGIGVADGLQVAVEPGFAEAFGAVGAAQVAAWEQGVSDAFGMWESPVLDFDITFDGAAVLGQGVGFEIDVFALPASDPLLQGFDGFTAFTPSFQTTVGLTNGDTISNGWAILGADIYLGIENVLAFGINAIPYLVRLLGHEIGHAIGLDHPNEFPFANFDQDNDPTNPMPIDPLDPTAGLAISPFIDPDAIMSSPFSFASLFADTLAPDDVAGRDVLYPLAVLPEPGAALLALAAASATALRRRRAGR